MKNLITFLGINLITVKCVASSYTITVNAGHGSSDFIAATRYAHQPQAVSTLLISHPVVFLNRLEQDETGIKSATPYKKNQQPPAPVTTWGLIKTESAPLVATLSIAMAMALIAFNQCCKR